VKYLNNFHRKASVAYLLLAIAAMHYTLTKIAASYIATFVLLRNLACYFSFLLDELSRISKAENERQRKIIFIFLF
jgi:hypothetical protein